MCVKPKYNIGQKVCISVQQLYEKYGRILSYTTIDACNDEDHVNYCDLLDLYGNLMSMDGETCTVVEVDSDSIKLMNAYGDSDTFFRLSNEEASIAIFK